MWKLRGSRDEMAPKDLHYASESISVAVRAGLVRDRSPSAHYSSSQCQKPSTKKRCEITRSQSLRGASRRSSHTRPFAGTPERRQTIGTVAHGTVHCKFHDFRFRLFFYHGYPLSDVHALRNTRDLHMMLHQLPSSGFVLPNPTPHTNSQPTNHCLAP